MNIVRSILRFGGAWGFIVVTISGAHDLLHLVPAYMSGAFTGIGFFVVFDHLWPREEGS